MPWVPVAGTISVEKGHLRGNRDGRRALHKRQAKRKWKRTIDSATSKLYEDQRFLNTFLAVLITRYSSFTAPVSEKQEMTDGNPERNNYPFRREIRQFLLEIVEEHFEKDDDLIVLQNMSDDPPRIDYINEVNRNEMKMHM